MASNIGFFIALLVLIIFALVAVCCFGLWLKYHPNSPSPYGRLPMGRASSLPIDSTIKILKYLYYRKDFENRIFEWKRAAVCRETGRVFPDCVTWYGMIRLDWTFLQKRHPGHYVSWGSLTEDQQLSVRDAHDSLDGFQTIISSPEPSPRAITREYALAVPGPLYVDIDTMTLLGWKQVPDTEFEVLVVQKKKREHEFQVKFD